MLKERVQENAGLIIVIAISTSIIGAIMGVTPVVFAGSGTAITVCVIVATQKQLNN